jgi:hypothetical protein
VAALIVGAALSLGQADWAPVIKMAASRRCAGATEPARVVISVRAIGRGRWTAGPVETNGSPAMGRETDPAATAAVTGHPGRTAHFFRSARIDPRETHRAVNATFAVAALQLAFMAAFPPAPSEWRWAGLNGGRRWGGCRRRRRGRRIGWWGNDRASSHGAGVGLFHRCRSRAKTEQPLQDGSARSSFGDELSKMVEPLLVHNG